MQASDMRLWRRRKGLPFPLRLDAGGTMTLNEELVAEHAKACRAERWLILIGCFFLLGIAAMVAARG